MKTIPQGLPSYVGRLQDLATTLSIVESKLIYYLTGLGKGDHFMQDVVSLFVISFLIFFCHSFFVIVIVVVYFLLLLLFLLFLSAPVVPFPKSCHIIM